MMVCQGRCGKNSASWRGIQTGFFGDDHFSGSHRNLLTANSRSIQFQKLASLTQVLSESFRKFPFRSPGTATGDITPHRPPSRAAGGRINRKKTFRATVIYGYQTASDPV